jgi:hypothetical protein
LAHPATAFGDRVEVYPRSFQIDNFQTRPCLDPRSHRKRQSLVAWRNPLHRTDRESCALSAQSATGQDTRSGQGALARRHTHGPLRAALLKTTVRCEGLVRRRSSFLVLLLQELRLFVGPKTNPDTDTGTGPIPPVTVFRVKAYSGGVLARALPEGLRYLST